MNNRKAGQTKFNMKNIFYRKEMELSLIVIFIGIITIFSLSSNTFLRLTNFMTVFSNVPAIGITAIGVAILLISGNIDISVGAISAFAGTLVVVLRVNFPEISIWLIILLTLSSGVIWGSINGFIITKIKLNSVITTLAMMAIIRGVAYIIQTGASGLLTDKGLIKYTRFNFFNYIPISAIYLILFIIIMIFIMQRTKFGRQVYATGENIDSAKLMGINTERVQYYCFVLSAIFASIAGILIVGQSGIGRADVARGNEFDALTIIVLGGISIKGGRGKLIGVLIAALIITTINNGLVHLGILAYWKDVVRGFILLCVISIDVVRRRGSIFEVIH